MKKCILIPAVFIGLAACNSTNKPGTGIPDATPEAAKNDTLPDIPQFAFMVDENKYTPDSADVSVYYSGSDSSLVIDAGKADGDRLHIVIADVKKTPGYRGNAWRSNNTKLAGTDSPVYQSTVSYTRNNGGVASWNNLDDGQHAQPPKEDNSLYIYGLRKTAERNFIIKGRINTRVLKNVYESASKEFNKDHTITGVFVIRFEDYWLKL